MIYGISMNTKIVMHEQVQQYLFPIQNGHSYQFFSLSFSTYQPTKQNKHLADEPSLFCKYERRAGSGRS